MQIGGIHESNDNIDSPILKSTSFQGIEHGHEWSHLADLSHDLESYDCPFDLSHCSD